MTTTDARTPVLIEIAKVIAVPLSVAFATFGFNFYKEKSDQRFNLYKLNADQRAASLTTSLSYVQLASGILSEQPPKELSSIQKKADIALRSWAVDVLEKSSPVSLTSDLKDALKQGNTAIKIVIAPFAQTAVQQQVARTQPVNQ